MTPDPYPDQEFHLDLLREPPAVRFLLTHTPSGQKASSTYFSTKPFTLKQLGEVRRAMKANLIRRMEGK